MQKVFVVFVLFFLNFESIATERFIKQTQRMRWIVEHYPPHNYAEEGVFKGIAIDVFKELYRRKGIRLRDKDFLLYPWARAYQTTRDEANVGLITMAFTEERSKLFQFVGPILNSDVSIMSKASRHISINEPKDLTDYVIGVVRKDIGETLLFDLGVTPLQLIQVRDSKAVLKMLLLERVDLIAYAEMISKFELEKMGELYSPLQTHMVLDTTTVNFAFSQRVPVWYVKEVQKELDKMHDEGATQLIQSKYVTEIE